MARSWIPRFGWLLLFLVSAWLCTGASAEVNPRNGALHLVFTDGSLPGTGYDLRIARVYNSHNGWDGLFGHGWCLQTFENRIRPLTTGVIALERCAPTARIYYRIRDWSAEDDARVAARLVAAVEKARGPLSDAARAELKAKLVSSAETRERLERELRLAPMILTDRVYVADGRNEERLSFNGHFFVVGEGGSDQKMFDLRGRLAESRDNNGNILRVVYDGTRLARLVRESKDGSAELAFSYDSEGSLEKIVFPGGHSTLYTVANGVLVKSRSLEGELHTFQYSQGLLVAVQGPLVEQQIQYDSATGSVVRVRDRSGCDERLEYKSSHDSHGHPDLLVTVRSMGCDTDNVSRFRYTFLDRVAVDAPLTAIQMERNDTVRELRFHERFGLAVWLKDKYGEREFVFDPSGRVVEILSADAHTIHAFENTCGKVSDVHTRFFLDKAGAIARQRHSHFIYVGSPCNLASVTNSDGQSVTLTYDLAGRIATVLDHLGRAVEIIYDPRTGKPQTITRPGVGTIAVTYEPDGTIEKVDSKDGPTVAVQVALTFNNLLDLIGPATSSENNAPCYRDACEDMSLWPGRPTGHAR